MVVVVATHVGREDNYVRAIILLISVALWLQHCPSNYHNLWEKQHTHTAQSYVSTQSDNLENISLQPLEMFHFNL